MRTASNRSLRRLAPVAVILLAAGCANDAQSGALLGAGIGALAGQAAGSDTESTLIGAGIGAGAGYIIGNEQDKNSNHAYDPNYDY